MSRLPPSNPLMPVNPAHHLGSRFLILRFMLIASYVVKRRFIRQNREIARVNSTQSLRIRNLEAEISRLLAENIAIREQAINNAQEVERLRSSQRIFRDVSRLKEQLESKLVEVGVLVTELGAIPEKARRRSSQHQRRKSGLVEPVKSPDQNDWKNRKTIAGVVAGERQVQEGRLPVIVEGKHYPRKTLDTLELSRLLDDDAATPESPELGPPPIAHFDVAEPIHFAPPTLPAGGTTQTANSYQDHEEDIKSLPDNLERRRKRRASALLEDMSKLDDTRTEVSKAADQSRSLKSGAKRKLDVREDGTKERSGSSALDDFAFQRKLINSEAPQARPKSSRFTKSAINSTADGESMRDAPMRLEPKARKVLAPKSTNSPGKARRVGANDKTIFTKDEGKARTKGLEHSRYDRVKEDIYHASTQIPSAEVEHIIIPKEPDCGGLPPKTPAGLELVSPASTEPSARTGQQTEIALSASVEDVLGGADGRTSRRARGAVSYAEPSLRVKMRRPTKELVAAVGDQTNGFKAQQRGSSARDESQERQPSQDSSATKMRTVMVKREKLNDDSAFWKDLPEAKEEPTSPLVNKVARPWSWDAPPTVEQEAGRSTELNAGTEELEAALDTLSIFDGPESSPHDSPSTVVVQSRKPSRRFSSNLASSRRVGQEYGLPPDPSNRPHSNSAVAGMNERPPRPSSAASLRKDDSTREEKLNLKRSASVSTLKASRGTNSAQGDSASSVVGLGRTERAAARRRSMMV
jgi:Shugoshin N-terminal coiled-coil region/Shugoshin C terminus